MEGSEGHHEAFDMWFDQRGLGAGQERRSMTATAIHRILSPVDFSESSRRALEYALDLARRRGAEVTVMHVAARTLPPLSALAAYASAALEGGVRERLRRDLLEELRRFVEPAAQDVRVKYAVEEGNVVGSIVEMAGRADLLVLGTHGHGEVEGVILGSVAEKALHRAPCPVLTVPRAAVARSGASATFEHILCPLDFSPSSKDALGYALALAREAGGRVTLLHVIEGLFGEKPVDIHLEVGGHLERAQGEARERLRAAVSPEDARWQEGEPLVATGKAHSEILRAAEQRRSDVIVMGLHGQSGLGQLLLGSTARHVVRAAPCPVLTLRSRREG
jgi:nucleotide-binding universal stress UspA family protein